MPGETLADALGAAIPLQAAGIGTMYTRLGENLENLAAADEVAIHYLGAIDQIVAAGIDGEVSVKPTQLGLDLDADVCLAHLVRLAEHAAAAGSYLWIDMEGSAYVEATISLYERLRAVQPRTGICLQAYLRRTAADIERLRPLDPAIRLVKGAYDEPASIAYTNRRSIDASFLGLAVRFLLDGRGRPIRLGLGTHDVSLIEQIAEQAAAAGIGRDGFEIEMLYGIREDQQYRLAAAGYRVQALIAYGEHWYPWYMRRLAERPANVGFAIRQLLP
jgi:Proline dehydrogenase